MRRLSLLLVLVLAGCAHAPQGGKTQTLSLEEGQTGTLSNGGKITFANVVNESRCPTGVQCVWAGTATVRFRLVPASGEPAADVLAVLPGGIGKDDVANLLPVDTLGVSVTLAELVPYPEANKEPGRRRALVRVRPLAP